MRVRARWSHLAPIAALSLSCRTGAAPPAPAPTAGAPPLQQTLAAIEPAPAAMPTDASRRLDAALDAFHRDHPSRRAHVTVDKPLYRPGETIWFRVFDLASATLDDAPAADTGVDVALVSPRGSVAAEKRVQDVDGVAANDFVLPPDLPGGEYTLRATGHRGGTVERKVIVASYEAPRVKKKLEFLRKAYGPGDAVAAAVALERATGAPLARHAAIGQVVVDGAEVARVPITTDAAGNAVVKFTLPGHIARGDGLLTILVDDGGVTESIQKRIPIALAELHVALFPEGGDLVRDLPGRVYLRATNLLDKPADVEGRVVDDTGAEVATFRSLHDGLARFDLTPRAGRRYHVEVTKPAGIRTRAEVPAARDRGCAMQAIDDPTSTRPEIRIAAWCSQPQQVIATAVLRDRRVATALGAARPDRPIVLALPTPDGVQGAARVTLFDQQLAPLAERLVYRHRGADLKVTITADAASYTPRAPVTLTVAATDAAGKPVQADLALAVTDDTVLSFADDKTGHLLSRLYLESEMPGQIVEEPNFYFGDDPQAPAALDLVLGTQGWRRFDWKPVLSGPPPAPRTPIEEPWDFVGDVWRDDRARANRRKMPERKAAEEEDAPDKPAVEQAAEAFVAAPRKMEEPPLPRAQPAQPAPAPPPAEPAPARQEELGADDAELDLGEPAMDAVAARGWGAAAEVVVLEGRDANMGDFRQLREGANGRGIRIRGNARLDDGEWQGGEALPAWDYAREFPAPSYTGTYEGPRVDFRDTVLWRPSVKTDATGTAQVTFHLSDAVTSFRATAEGIGGGRAGRGDAVVQSKLPVSLAVKLPLEVSRGDTIRLPVTITNETDTVQRATLTTAFGAAFRVTGAAPPHLDLAPRERRALFYDLAVVGDGRDAASGKATIALEASRLRDEVSRTIRVVELGFPEEVAQAGTLARHARHELVLGAAIGETYDAKLTLYPSPIASITRGTEALLAEPGGCFEQASSTNYPNAMVMSFIATGDAVDPAVVERSKGMLDRGYNLLTGYESPGRGYEWFGSDPGHEALTAYGLMEFNDMAKVYDVDRAMVDRTAQWLLKRRDGKGGFQRSAQALDSFGRASPEVTDAYIVYALVEAGTKGIDAEIAAQRAVAARATDPYVLALAANTTIATGAGTPAAKDALARLLALQAADGSFPGADHSITRSGGVALSIETTALAALAMMKAGPTTMEPVRKAIDWLNAQREGGGAYGSTQSTVLAFKALTTYATFARRTRSPGVVVVKVDGRPVERVAYEAGHQGAIEVDLARHLRRGKNVVELELDSREPMPYGLGVRYRTTVPPSSPRTAVALSTKLERRALPLGESATLRVVLENRTDRGLPMTLARIGLPGGLTFQTWQLKELRDKKLVDFYETREREVVLYLRAMPPRDRRELVLELKADVPGTYTAPASSAYLYYTDEDKAWVPPVAVTVEK